MIYVLDASVIIDLLLARQPYCSEIEPLMQKADTFAVPHLLDVEVAQVLRRFVIRGELTYQRAQQAIDDLLDLPLTRYPHERLITRCFQLVNNLTMYDAIYVVLADVLDATLLTRDNAMKDVPGTNIRVQVIGK